MKQSCVSAFARVVRLLALAAVAMGLGATQLHAQASGKIEGRVRDQAGAPIASAQVRISGSSFGAVTNPQGYYFINNVPAGTVDLTATFVGYKPVGVTGLKVLAGQTITQDFTLEQTPVEVTTIEVVAATNALVPRDEVTSKQRIDGEFARNLPVDRINAVLALQPGVVVNNNNQLTIRGGRIDEAATYVDGVPVSSGNRATSSLSRSGGVGLAVSAVSVPTNGFEEASVTTGASSAEFGNAQSGIISIQTKSGGSKYAGSASYETDTPFGANHSAGFNRVTATIGGPISKDLTFSLSGGLEGTMGFDRGFGALTSPEYIMAGVDTSFTVASGTDSVVYAFPKFAIGSGNCNLFANSGSVGASAAGNPADPNAAAAISGIRSNYGLGCTGVRSNYSPQSNYQLQGKVSYSYGTGSHISVTGLRNQQQRRIDFAGGLGNPFSISSTNVLAPQLGVGRQLRSQAYILNWTQNLAKSSERALALDVYLSYQQDRTIQGNLTSQGELDSRNPKGGFLLKGLDFLWNFDNLPITPQRIAQFRAGDPAAFPLLNAGDYLGTNTELRLDPYGEKPNLGLLEKDPTNFFDYQLDQTSSPSGRIRLYNERRYIGKANLDWQVDRYNRLKLGGEFTRFDMALFNAPATYGAPVCFCDAYIEKPIQYNGYIENRLDLGDVVVVGGLRYDYYDSRGFHTVYNGPQGSFPMPNFGIPHVSLVRDKSHNYLSPHIQVAFPVTERTNFRLSYAHQVQTPDFSLVFSGENTNTPTASNNNTLYGTDLDFGKTITFEFGIRHAFSDDMVLDVAAFNKDKLSDVSARTEQIFTPVNSDTTGNTGQLKEYRMYENKDFGTIRGLDVRLDRRFGNWFNGTLAYTFQDSKNTGTDPSSTVSFFSQLVTPNGNLAQPPQAVLTSDDSRPHTIAGSAALTVPGDWRSGTALGSLFRNVGVFATFRYASGTPYTTCALNPQNPKLNQSIVSGGVVCDGGDVGGNELNGARLPASKNFDLRITKGFTLGGLALTAYGDIRNLFNFQNVLTVFSATGTTSNPAEFTQILAAEVENLQSEASANGAVLNAAGDIGLPGDCSGWTTPGTVGGVVNCFSLVRAEERYGDGDGVFTAAEQTAAFRARYDLFRGGIFNFTGLPRRVRLGLEISF